MVHWYVILSVIAGKVSHEYVFNSDCLLRYSGLYLQTQIFYNFVGFAEKRSWQKTVDTRDEMQLAVWMLLSASRNIKIKSDERKPILAQFPNALFSQWCFRTFTVSCNKFVTSA